MFDLWGNVRNVFTSIRNFIIKTIQDAIDFFMRKINDAKDAVSDLAGSIPGVGTATSIVEKGSGLLGGIGSAFGKISPFHVGTQNFGGGLAQVHKDEIISMPQGSKVFTRRQSENMVSMGIAKSLAKVLGQQKSNNVNFNAPITFGGTRGMRQEQDMFANLLMKSL